MPLDFSNKSNTYDQKVGVSDEGTGAGVLGSAAGSGGIALGLGANFGNTTNFGTITDGGATKMAFDFGRAVVSEVSAGAAANSAAAVKGNTDLLGGALAAITDLGKVSSTGGQSDTNKTFLYLGLGLAALAALFLFRR